MKKVFLFILPLILAALVFFVLTFFFKIGPSGKGSLQTTSTPKAKVYLDGKLIGETPLCRCELSTMFPSGDYAVKLIPEEGEFKPFEQKVTINKGTLSVVDATFGTSLEGSVVNLSPLANKKDMELLVISFPDKSDVFLDNSLVGTTPFLIKNITESDHDLKISKDGYKDKLIKISTHVGYRLTSVVFLGVNSVADVSSSVVATPSSAISVQKILIKSPVGYVNVRDMGSLNGIKIGEVYSGDTFDLVEEKDGWFEIKLNDGKTGWIISSYAIKK